MKLAEPQSHAFLSGCNCLTGIGSAGGASRLHMNGSEFIFAHSLFQRFEL